jgi:hypothetical protein
MPQVWYAHDTPGIGWDRPQGGPFHLTRIPRRDEDG